ncbi:MAG: cysteine desulfurase [Clostridiales bacterium]|nr:cysteine desulfurase [Clostridiales bacterium]
MRVYADHAATTPCDKRVVEAMLPYFTSDFGNADSQHFYGRDTAKAVADARETVANIIGCKPNELYFTGSGTESDNWALKGVALHKKDKGNHVIISSIEHHAILTAAEWLEKNGFRVTRLPVDSTGLVKVADLEKAIDEQTTIVSIMYVNNEVGTIQPIKELAEVAHKHGALFHSDCVQAIPYMKIDVKDLGVDLLTISGHKFYGPKGVGALYIRNGVKLDKLICGGGQERSQRGGTTNTPAVVGMAKALELSQLEMERNNMHIAQLRDHFVQRVQAEIPYVRFNGNKAHCVPSIANFSFEFVEGEGILMLMDFNGIAVSSGSACSSGSLDPSHVLLAMGVPIEVSHGSIRFSFGKDNTMEEVDFTVDKLKDTIGKLREMSPLFNLKTGGTYNV